MDLSQPLSRIEYKIAIKLGVAASLSLLAGMGFSRILEHPNYSVSATWCVLTSFVVLQAHLGGTYRAAWIRLLGVAIGAFMGGVFTSFFGSNFISLGISVFLTVLICSFFNIKESIRIACMSVSVVMILWGVRPAVSPWTFGFFRFIDSALGILVAVFVAHLIWPAQATTKLRQNLSHTLALTRKLYRLAMDLAPEPKDLELTTEKISKQLDDIFVENRQFLQDSKLEILSRTTRIEEWEALIDHMESVYSSTLVLIQFRNSNITQILDKSLRERLEETIHQIELAMRRLCKQLEKVEVKESEKLLESIEQLNEDLCRFRTTHTTRKFDRKEVEYFFVYFYNLRTVSEELLKVEEIVLRLKR